MQRIFTTRSDAGNEGTPATNLDLAWMPESSTEKAGIGIMKGILVALTVSAALLIGSNVATAQYAEPTGNLTVTSEVVTATTGAGVTLSCTLRDTSGAPIVNAPCTFTIESEPGTDAEVGSKVVTKMTDANGIATTVLRTGSTPGQIVVSATSGTFRSVTVVTIAGATGAPPASPVTPPSTGDGGLK
jgi:hypothetical protein